jgi:glyoxylase-like metal-dependent hydrolase (beta-lactamase superfamily II)
VQRFRITDRVTLYCFQLPGGGNIYLFDAPTDQMMVDTGYGIYHEHVMEMFRKYDPGDLRRLSRIFITHADADHAGAAGHFTVPCHLHDGTLTIIERANRAYGSQREESILEEAYTKMINTLSQVTVPKQPCVLPKAPVGRRGPFSLLDRFTIGDLELEVLEGLGGHLHGQCYLCAPEQGLLFTADTVINVDHLSPERTAYNQIAVFLVLSVNADSTRAKEERSALIGIAQEIDRRLSKGGRRCLVCGGHGPVSVLDGDVLVPCGGIVRYIPSCP